MRIYRTDVITLELSNEGGSNEPKIAMEAFNKMSKIAKRIGFKKDFTPEESEFIQKTSETLNSYFMT